jgi:hypothetical protein
MLKRVYQTMCVVCKVDLREKEMLDKERVVECKLNSTSKGIGSLLILLNISILIFRKQEMVPSYVKRGRPGVPRTRMHDHRTH